MKDNTGNSLGIIFHLWDHISGTTETQAGGCIWPRNSKVQIWSQAGKSCVSSGGRGEHKAPSLHLSAEKPSMGSPGKASTKALLRDKELSPKRNNYKRLGTLQTKDQANKGHFSPCHGKR